MPGENEYEEVPSEADGMDGVPMRVAADRFETARFSIWAEGVFKSPEMDKLPVQMSHASIWFILA